jgi:hypothetical protein
MTLKFLAQIEERIPASAPHPPKTEYRVGIGAEDWDGPQPLVLKVQMVYVGKIHGRQAPSYPIDSDDEQRVREAIDRVLALYRQQIKSQLFRLGGNSK